MLLTFDEIEKYGQNPLPLAYQIKTPAVLKSSQLAKILLQFTKREELIRFLSKITHSTSISVQINQETITLGSPIKLMRIFVLEKYFQRELKRQKSDWIKSYFYQITYDKADLTYLFTHFTCTETREFLDTYSFNKSDVLAIVNSPENFQNIEPYMARLLYHYLNPVRKWGASLTPLLDMNYFTYRIGHVLGLDGKLISTVAGKKCKFKFEYGMASSSLQILVGYLESYRLSNPSGVADTIYHAIKQSYQLMLFHDYFYDSSAPQTLFDQYTDGELIYISTGWGIHCVALAFYGKHVIYCNRGEEANPDFGCGIYEINSDAITVELLEKLMCQNLSREKFHELLKTIFDIDNPFLSFRSKSQKHSTCTFVNPKSIIEGMIVLVRAGLNASRKCLLSIYDEEYKRKKYKFFTNYIRDKEIDELIKNMFYANKPDLILFYANLCKEIIRQHHGKGRGYIKDKDEIVRAVDLFNRMPDKILQHLLADSDFMNLMQALNTKHQALFGRDDRVAKTSNRLFVTSYNNYSQHSVLVDKKGYICRVDERETPKMPFSFSNARKLISLRC